MPKINLLISGILISAFFICFPINLCAHYANLQQELIEDINSYLQPSNWGNSNFTYDNPDSQRIVRTKNLLERFRNDYEGTKWEAYWKKKKERWETIKEHGSTLMLWRMNTEDRANLIVRWMKLPKQEISSRASAIKANQELLLPSIYSIYDYMLLSGEQITARAAALKANQTIFFTNSMTEESHSFIAAKCMLLTPDEIIRDAQNIQANKINPFVYYYYPPFSKKGSSKRVTLANEQWTPEKITARTKAIQSEKMDEYQIELFNEACTPLTSEEITARFQAIQTAADAEMQMATEAIPPKPFYRKEFFYDIKEWMQLSPEQIDALSKNLFVASIKDGSCRKSEYRKQIITTCLSLTPAEITARIQTIKENADKLFKHAPVLIHSSLSIRVGEIIGEDRDAIIAACMNLTPKEIEERAKTIQENQEILFRGMSPSHYRVNMIVECLKLPSTEIVSRAQAIKDNLDIIVYRDGGLISEHNYNMLLFIKISGKEITKRAKAIKEFEDVLLSPKESSYPNTYYDNFIIYACMSLPAEELLARTKIIKSYEEIFKANLVPYYYGEITLKCLDLDSEILSKRAEAIRGIRTIILNRRLSSIEYMFTIKSYLEMNPEYIRTIRQ